MTKDNFLVICNRLALALGRTSSDASWVLYVDELYGKLIAEKKTSDRSINDAANWLKENHRTAYLPTAYEWIRAIEYSRAPSTRYQQEHEAIKESCTEEEKKAVAGIAAKLAEKYGWGTKGAPDNKTVKNRHERMREKAKKGLVEVVDVENGIFGEWMPREEAESRGLDFRVPVLQQMKKNGRVGTIGKNR